MLARKYHKIFLLQQNNVATLPWTRKPSWCWHTRATQKRWKKFLHFEVI